MVTTLKDSFYRDHLHLSLETQNRHPELQVANGIHTPYVGYVELDIESEVDRKTAKSFQHHVLIEPLKHSSIGTLQLSPKLVSPSDKNISVKVLILVSRVHV